MSPRKIQPTFVRTTISVPATLKVRMDQLAERVNWSALACEAFEQKLAALITAKGAKTMEEVVLRLQASKQKQLSALFEVGYQAGAEWARQVAEYDHLERLATAYAGSSSDWDRNFEHAPRHWFAQLVAPAWECEAFWEAALAVADLSDEFDVADPDFVRGFASGALAIWHAVKGKLDDSGR